MHTLLSTTFTWVPAEWLGVLLIVSILSFVGSLILIPVILIRLPADYFMPQYSHRWLQGHHPLLRVLGHVLKNVTGVVFLCAGLAMLVLPGQGLLTILIGLSFLDFPGKRRLEAAVLGQPTVLRTINALRARFGRPPLIILHET